MRWMVCVMAAAMVAGCGREQQAAEAESESGEVETLRLHLNELSETVLNQGTELAEMRERVAQTQKAMDELTVGWTKRAMATSAIPAEVLASGYALPFAGDAHLAITPVGEGAMGNDAGGVNFRGGSSLRTTTSAAMLSVPWSARGELSMATAIRPANLTMAGPARIITISRGAGERNFTLGQEGSKLVVRFRTTQSGINGSSPELTSPENTLSGETQAVVFVRRREMNHLYVDGQLVTSLEVPGDLSNWDFSLPLALGNELDTDRAWAGDINRAVFFNRALSDDEVQTLSQQMLSAGRAQ